MTTHGKRKLSLISLLHYWKLFFRSALFLTALVLYIIDRINGAPLYEEVLRRPLITTVIWLVFVVEMILRFFPSRLESMGCQKQFARNYRPAAGENARPVLQSAWTTASVIIAWFALNGAIGALYFAGILDQGILLLIALAYSVCDMICILFFCPFQTWFMKNRCCATCRIYNWDFAMMFTPLVFIPGLYTWSLLGIALALLIQWEILLRLHPERFSEATNQCLACRDCPEKLCHHKKQLQSFLRRNREYLRLKGNAIIHPDKEK